MKAQNYFQVAFAAIIALMLGMSPVFGANDKPRVIIETDIGIGDGDDDASLVRFLLYADVLDIEGMIVTKSGNMHRRYGALKDGYEFMEKFMDAYEQVRPNLIAHSPGYPTADYLRKRVARSWTSEGVDLIIAAVDRGDVRPVWYCNWGTSNSLGPALDKVKSTRSEKEYRKFISRLRVSSLWNKGTVPNHFNAFTSTYVDIGNFEPQKKRTDPYWHSWDDCTVIYWIQKNLDDFNYERDRRFPYFIAKGHGPLCELYCHAKEGDTPATSLLFPVGLNHVVDPHPGWGSWAGRASQVDTDAARHYSVPTERGNFWWYKKEKDANHDNFEGSINRDNCLKRWGLHIQNDFMARIEWCVKSYAEANHPPKVVLNGDESLNVLEITAKAGSIIRLNATGSSDPDGDKLSYEWIYYPEPGTYGARHDLDAIKINNPKAKKASFKMPGDIAEGQAIHIVLIVTDDGDPALTRYRRIIVSGG